MTPLRWFLAGGLTCGTGAVVLLLVAIARRGAPGPEGIYVKPDTLYHIRSHSFSMDSDGAIREGDDWASDPRTAELATGGGR